MVDLYGLNVGKFTSPIYPLLQKENILLMEEILHHLLSMKPYGKWDILRYSPYQLVSLPDFFPSAVFGCFQKCWYPKMDGENNGSKTLWTKWMIWGVLPPLFFFQKSSHQLPVEISSFSGLTGFETLHQVRGKLILSLEALVGRDNWVGAPNNVGPMVFVMFNLGILGDYNL